LECYDIISHGQRGYGARERGYGRGTSRESLVHNLTLLLDFLGARQIADVLRSSSGGGLSSSRRSLTGGF